MKRAIKLFAFIIIVIVAFVLVAGCKKRKTTDTFTSATSTYSPSIYENNAASSEGTSTNNFPIIAAPVSEAPKIIKLDKLEVSISLLSLARNSEPFESQWEDFPVYLPEWPFEIDWEHFNRIRVKVKYYGNNMEEINPDIGKATVSLIYDPEGNWKDSPEDDDTNVPFKAFNLMESSENISTDEGEKLSLEKMPLIILFQSGNPNVAYIEVTEITFFWSEEEDEEEDESD